MADLLLELGLEEIPDRFLPGLRAGLGDKVHAALAAAGVKCDRGSAIETLGGPRRLAVIAKRLPARLPDEWKKGPPIGQAITADGRPSPAAEGFAKKLGVTLDELTRGGDGKFLLGLQKGARLDDLLPAALARAVKALDLPKAMRWGSGEHEFVRPLRWVVALLDGEVVPLTLFGIASGRESQGPRRAGGNPVSIASPSAYESSLEAAGVFVAFERRKARIRELLSERARESGGAPVADDELLGKVTDLVENPGVIAGDFDPGFLKVPHEILACAMREHQKNFAVYGAGSDELLPKFLAVTDKPADPRGFVRRGNEAVLRSRLADARFFHDEDLKQGLEALREKTRNITFFAGLGSYLDKSERLRLLCDWLGDELGLPAPSRKALLDAATYCKADLASNLIGEKEFNVLQGKAGGYYGRAAGLDERAVAAISAQYAVSPGTDPVVHLLGLADRLDTLAGFFMTGKLPTGSKDPFALRRAGNQFWQLYYKSGAALPDLADWVAAAGRGYSPVKVEKADWAEALAKFLGERLENHLVETGFSKSEFRAVAGEPLHDWAARKGGPQRALRILEALRAQRDAADFAAVCEGATRVANILKGQPGGAGFDPAQFREPAERELDAARAALAPEVARLKDANEFAGCFSVLARLRAPLDRYFARDSNVMVMAGDPALRANRLAFLRALSGLFEGLFDPALLAGEARG